MRVRIVDGKVVSPTMDVHNHAPNPAKNEQKKIINNSKEESVETGKSIRAVISETYKNVSCGVSSALPKINFLKRTVPRVWVQMEAAPPNSKFLSYDSGTDDQFRALIFTITENLDLMKSCDHWFCDEPSTPLHPFFHNTCVAFLCINTPCFRIIV